MSTDTIRAAGTALLRAGSRLVTGLLDLAMPVRCAACDRPAGTGMHMLCDDCAARIPMADGSCPRCGAHPGGDRCPVCADRAWYIDRGIAVAEYRGVMRDVLRGLKFRGRRALHVRLGDLARESLMRARISSDIITFVPMNPAKKRRRGYNQSELIARHISRVTGIPCRPLLAERRVALTQRELGVRDRFLNTLCRYRLLPGPGGRGRSVLLVDDVLTTGATVNQCARLLREAGCREVFTLTMARAEIKRLEML